MSDRKMRRKDGKPNRAYAGGRVSLRLGLVRAALGQGYPSGAIADKFAKEWKISPRTVQSYIQTAREERRRDFEESAKNGDLLADLLAKLDVHYRECMKAGQLSAAGKDLDRFAQWGGLDIKRVELSGPGGSPIETSAAIELKGLPEEAFKAICASLGVDDKEE